MAMTLEQINEERARFGREPLTELPKKEGSPAPEAKKDEKKEENPEEKKTTPEANTDEISDSTVLEILRKKGFNVNSFDELKAPVQQADPEKEAEEREAAKLTYGLQKGLFKRKDYENYISDSKDPVNLVYDEYAQKAKKESPDLTEEQILEEFKDDYGLNSEKGSRKFNRGQEDLALRSQKILQSKYGKIISLDSEFGQYESTQKAEKDRQQKILAQAPIKKKEIETAFSQIRKVKWEADKDDFIELDYSDDAINVLQQKFLDPKFVEQMIEEDWDAEKIKDIADTALTKANLPYLLKKASEKYLEKHGKGSRGIPDQGKPSSEKKSEPKLSERQMKMYEEAMANKQLESAAN